VYEPITDDETMEALKLLSRLEGIIPALESAHALALAFKKAKAMGKDQAIVVNLSGRGDKDVEQIKHRLEAEGEA
jgi:tryptophan synthase beta chain